MNFADENISFTYFITEHKQKINKKYKQILAKRDFIGLIRCVLYRSPRRITLRMRRLLVKLSGVVRIETKNLTGCIRMTKVPITVVWDQNVCLLKKWKIWNSVFTKFVWLQEVKFPTVKSILLAWLQQLQNLGHSTESPTSYQGNKTFAEFRTGFQASTSISH